MAGLVALDPSASGLWVTGVTHDSRAVQPGDLYAALPGARVHGAAYVADAVAAGALAVLTDPDGRDRALAGGRPVLLHADPRAVLGEVARWVYGAPADDLLVVGVTGTNGKTTTAYLVESGLRAAGHRTGLVGTVETRIADQTLTSVRTTPEAPELQGLFAVMRERGVTAVAMEVSSHALALHRVDGTSFDVGIFTNLSQDHLDFHPDLADYFAAKRRLFAADRCRQAVVIVDDAYGAELARTVDIPVVTCSTGGVAADWVATDVRLGADGCTFTARGPAGVEHRLRLRLAGRFNVANALAAFVALVVAGVPEQPAAAGIAQLAGVPGRMERIDLGQPFLAIVDYAHTPEAVTQALGALRSICTGRVIGVLGCGGDRDRAKRPLMGEALAAGADLAILTNDNPRSEDPEAILAEMVEGTRRVPAAHRARISVLPDRADAIAEAVRAARAGDVVLVAGKGHETGQEIGGVVHPFDDRESLRAAIREAGSAA